MTNATIRSILDYRSADGSKDGFRLKKHAYYMIWFEFLAISPSYELARRCRAGTLTERDKENLPADFDEVLAVYDDLGNVQRVLFPIWWRKVGFQHFGLEGSTPSVRRVGYLPHNKKTRPDVSTAIDKYIDTTWVDQGNQRTVLIAIPVGLPKGRITRQVNSILSKISPEKKSIVEPKTKYPILGKRHHKGTLFRYLGAVWIRSAMRKQPLWRVGARAQISDTYSPVLDPSGPRARRGDDYDRELMAIMTSRALLRARMIAENAARGKFPIYTRNEHALDFDYQYLYKAISTRQKWRRAEVKRIRELEASAQHSSQNHAPDQTP